MRLAKCTGSISAMFSNVTLKICGAPAVEVRIYVQDVDTEWHIGSNLNNYGLFRSMLSQHSNSRERWAQQNQTEDASSVEFWNETRSWTLSSERRTSISVKKLTSDIWNQSALIRERILVIQILEIRQIQLLSESKKVYEIREKENVAVQWYLKTRLRVVLKIVLPMIYLGREVKQKWIRPTVLVCLLLHLLQSIRLTISWSPFTEESKDE